MGLINSPKRKSISKESRWQGPPSQLEEKKEFDLKGENQINNAPPISTKHERTHHIKYPIQKLIFNDGNVSFSCELDSIKTSIEVVIENDFIKKIHDSIRPYFSNVLNTKYINVVISLRYTTTTDSNSSRIDIEEVYSKSSEIDRITPDLIENVKLRFLRSQISKPNTNDKSLLTKDELLLMGSNNESTKELFENDEDLLEAILKITNTKHHEHLQFLSEIHDHKTMRLRFVTKPISFIFLITGKADFHFVWETSDTKEATYIWAAPKSQITDKSLSLKQKLNELDLIITEIIQNGKMPYIQKQEESFTRIIHTYTENLDGFNRWKHDLLNLTT